jgi:hypothetical protein
MVVVTQRNMLSIAKGFADHLNSGSRRSQNLFCKAQSTAAMYGCLYKQLIGVSACILLVGAIPVYVEGSQQC